MALAAVWVVMRRTVPLATVLLAGGSAWVEAGARAGCSVCVAVVVAVGGTVVGCSGGGGGAVCVLAESWATSEVCVAAVPSGGEEEGWAGGVNCTMLQPLLVRGSRVVTTLLLKRASCGGLPSIRFVLCWCALGRPQRRCEDAAVEHAIGARRPGASVLGADRSA